MVGTSPRVALVTGGTAGIGSSIVQRLVNDGQVVVSAGRRRVAKAQIDSLELDLTEPGSAEAAVAHVIATHGRLDILVNNAGTMLVDDVADGRSTDWDAMTAVNFRVPMECARAALPHLLAASEGSLGCSDIVFIGSLAAVAPSTGRAVYSATKAGVQVFADVLRIELADTGVRVAVVSPGLTSTELRAGNRPESLEKMAAAATDLAGVEPLHPDSVADAVAWIIGQPPEVSVSELVIRPSSQGR